MLSYLWCVLLFLNLSACVHVRDIESALGDECIKCADADPCSALRADLKCRKFAALDEAAEGGITNAQGLRSFADCQCKVGVHWGGYSQTLVDTARHFFMPHGVYAPFDKCP